MLYLFYFVLAGKTWPIHVGIGTGLGMGLANCQHEFKDPYGLRAKLKVGSILQNICDAFLWPGLF